MVWWTLSVAGVLLQLKAVSNITFYFKSIKHRNYTRYSELLCEAIFILFITDIEIKIHFFPAIDAYIIPLRIQHNQK